jgi:hypothetical protein
VACRLADTQPPVPVPQLKELKAVPLFLDVSGFTPLTERLCERGPQGAELVRNYLSAFFEELLSTVSLFGGDVIKATASCAIVYADSDTVCG